VRRHVYGQYHGICHRSSRHDSAYSASIPATDLAKIEECLQAGPAIRNLLVKELKPCDIMTREAFENAMVIVMALGGSTNAVLHLIAIAKSVGIKLSIDDFQAVSNRVPYLADLKPSGVNVMEDLHYVGGTPALMKYLLAEGFLNGDCLTVTGQSIAENLAPLPGLKEGQQIVRPSTTRSRKPGTSKSSGATSLRKGRWRRLPGRKGCCSKVPPGCLKSEEDTLAALERHEVQKGEVVVIRYEGPKGGPECPKC